MHYTHLGNKENVLIKPETRITLKKTSDFASKLILCINRCAIKTGHC